MLIKKIYICCYIISPYKNNQKAKAIYLNIKDAILNLKLGGTIYELEINYNDETDLQTNNKIYVLMKKSKDPDVFAQPEKSSLNLLDFSKYKLNRSYRVDKVYIF